MDGGKAQRVGNGELAEGTRELGFRGLAYQVQPLCQLHEKMSRALDGVAPPNVDKVLDNHRFVTGGSPQERRPKTGELSAHFMTCVPSTGLTLRGLARDSGAPPNLTDQLLDLLPAAVYVCAPDGTILRFNRRAAELWGRAPLLSDPRDRFCGAYRLYRPDGDLLPHDKCPLADILHGGIPVIDEEVVIERPDGSRGVALVNIRPLKDADQRSAAADRAEIGFRRSRRWPDHTVSA